MFGRKETFNKVKKAILVTHVFKPMCSACFRGVFLSSLFCTMRSLCYDIKAGWFLQVSMSFLALPGS